jgi:hypothetical protein
LFINTVKGAAQQKFAIWLHRQTLHRERNQRGIKIRIQYPARIHPRNMRPLLSGEHIKPSPNQNLSISLLRGSVNDIVRAGAERIRNL